MQHLKQVVHQVSCAAEGAGSTAAVTPRTEGGDALQREPRELRMMPRLGNTVSWLQLLHTVRSPGFT